MKLVVGLGNPGKQYQNTRHNMGFMIVDKFLGDVKWSNKFNGLYYEENIAGEKFVFLKPQSYMNLSGGVVAKFASYYKIDAHDILVIHDDLDLPVGKFRIKIASSSGGHNGIKDIIACLGTNEFVRLKVGVSHQTHGDTKDYVLGVLSKSENAAVFDNFDKFCDIIKNYEYANITMLMNKYN